MLALASGLEHLMDHPDRDQDVPIVVCSDSMAPLALLRPGPSAQTSPLGIAAWRALVLLAQDSCEIRLQWVQQFADSPGMSGPM